VNAFVFEQVMTTRIETREEMEMRADEAAHHRLWDCSAVYHHHRSYIRLHIRRGNGHGTSRVLVRGVCNHGWPRCLGVCCLEIGIRGWRFDTFFHALDHV